MPKIHYPVTIFQNLILQSFQIFLKLTKSKFTWKCQEEMSEKFSWHLSKLSKPRMTKIDLGSSYMPWLCFDKSISAKTTTLAFFLDWSYLKLKMFWFWFCCICSLSKTSGHLLKKQGSSRLTKFQIVSDVWYFSKSRFGSDGQLYF